MATQDTPKPYLHVTAGVIVRDGRMLIAQRREGDHMAGLWEFPGGKQERGESLETCLAREVHEELGIRIQVQNPLVTVEHDDPVKTVCLHVFKCRWVEGEPQALECADFRWTTCAELAAYVFPPADRQVIALLTRSAGEEADLRA